MAAGEIMLRGQQVVMDWRIEKKRGGWKERYVDGVGLTSVSSAV